MKRTKHWVAAAAATVAPALGLAADVVTKVEDLGLLLAPVTLSLGNAFNDLNASLPGIQLNLGGTAVSLMPGDRFADAYRFSTDGALINAIAGTIDLNTSLDLNGLELRLYGGDSLPQPALGAASPYAGLVAQASGSGTGEMRAFDNLMLPAGNYVMEVSGLVVGSTGGSYASVVNASPVPEPHGVLLAAAAMGLLGVFSRRRGA